MDNDDRDYTDILNDALKDLEPRDELHGNVRDCITRSVARAHRRNTALGAVVVAIVVVMALSTVTPVFGRNGTLAQVITAMSAERQAEKMSKALGTAPVQQTAAVLQTSGETIQAVSDSALSETDGLLALVIAERAKKPVADVLKLRTTGLGWGRIMAELNVSSRDIGEAISQVETVIADVNTTHVTPSDKVVVSGEITSASATNITVAGTSFVVASETEIKYRGKAATPAEIATMLLGSRLYATVQGTRLADASLRAKLVTVRDAANDGQGSGTVPNHEQEVHGKVTAVTPTTLRVEGFAYDIVISATTKVEQNSAGHLDITAIKVGQTVEVDIHLSGTTYVAQQVDIKDKYVNPGTGTGTTVPNHEQEVHGKVTAVTPTTLRVEGFAYDIVISATTKVEQNSAGHLDITAIKVGQTVEVDIHLSGTTYVAQQVDIKDKYVNPGTGTGTTVPNHEQEVHGKVTAVTPTTLRVEGFAYDIVISATTKVEQNSAGHLDITAIKVGQTVEVDIHLSGTTYVAQQVDIKDKYVNPGTGTGTTVPNHEQEVHGKVTAVTPTTLRVEGFAYDIVISATTKVEQNSAGHLDITAIKVGQTVEVDIHLSGTTYVAQQVDIKDKYVNPGTGTGGDDSHDDSDEGDGAD